jgi:hypothetical protein
MFIPVRHLTGAPGSPGILSKYQRPSTPRATRTLASPSWSAGENTIGTITLPAHDAASSKGDVGPLSRSASNDTSFRFAYEDDRRAGIGSPVRLDTRTGTCYAHEPRAPVMFEQSPGAGVCAGWQSSCRRVVTRLVVRHRRDGAAEIASSASGTASMSHMLEPSRLPAPTPSVSAPTAIP